MAAHDHPGAAIIRSQHIPVRSSTGLTCCLPAHRLPPQDERRRSEQLLYQMIPHFIADQLRRGERTTAETYPEVRACACTYEYVQQRQGFYNRGHAP